MEGKGLSMAKTILKKKSKVKENILNNDEIYYRANQDSMVQAEG